MWWVNVDGHSHHIELGEAVPAGIHGKAASRLPTVRQPGSAAVTSTQARARLHRQTLAYQKRSELTKMTHEPLVVVDEDQTSSLASSALAC